MKFQRRARIFRGKLDVAPFAALFFLVLCCFMMRSLVYTPGVIMQVTPPVADGFAGTDNPTITMAVTSSGQFLFDNQVVEEADLKSVLAQKVSAAPKSAKGLTLVVIPDKSVTYEVITKIRSLARDAGISEVLEAVRPSAYSMKAK